MPERMDVFYKEITRIPVLMQTQGEVGRTLPVSVSLTRGNLDVLAITVERPVIKTDRIPMYVSQWNPPTAGDGIPSVSSSRFPLVVRVWGQVLGYLQVTAHVVKQHFTADVVAYFPGYSEGEDAYPRLRIIYKVWNEVVHAASTSIHTIADQKIKLAVHVHTWYERTRALLFTVAKQNYIQQPLKFITSLKYQFAPTAFNIATKIKKGVFGALPTMYMSTGQPAVKYVASLVTNITSTALALLSTCKTSLRKIKESKSTSLRAFVGNARVSFKSSITIYSSRYLATMNNAMHVHIFSPAVKRYYSLTADIRRIASHFVTNSVYIEKLTGLYRRYGTFRASIKQQIKQYSRYMYVDIRGVDIEKVLSYIKITPIWFVRKFRTIFIVSPQVKHTRSIIYDTWIVKSTRKIVTDTWSITKKANIVLTSFAQATLTKIIWSSQRIVRPIKAIFPLINKTIREILAKFTTLPTKAEKNIQFAPLSETKQTKAMLLMMRKAKQYAQIQWWVRNIGISSEGYSLEIIFDLDDRGEGIGPLPPIGVESWEGGYVDYPFKGMGVTETNEASGYMSPEGEAWVKNVTMLWSKPTQIFDGGDGE